MGQLIIPQELSNGKRIEYNNDVFTVVDFQHVKPGKGGSFVRTKLKSLTTGRVLDNTFKGTEKIQLADVEYRKMQFSYREADDCVFMDLDSYEQITMPQDVLGDAVDYIKEGEEVTTIWWKSRPISMDIPAKVDLVVTDTIPGEKGNTVNNAMKPATMETGVVVQVPMFINVGDKIRIDTRDGSYESRV